MIWNFKNVGLSWCKEPEYVNVYDFPKDALGRAIPYNIDTEVLANSQTVLETSQPYFFKGFKGDKYVWVF